MQCVQETCNFDTLYAYLTCGNYDFNYDRNKNLYAPLPKPAHSNRRADPSAPVLAAGAPSATSAPR